MNMAQMEQIKVVTPDYGLMRENDELKRRISRLEEKTTFLQDRTNELYKVLAAKNSFLDFEFAKDEDDMKEGKRMDSRRIRSMLSSMRR